MEKMFIGEYTHSIDDKNRLAVPIKFRNKLAEGAVVTKGLDDCLFLYPQGEWGKIADKLSNLPISQSGARAFARLMLAGAMDVDIDRQGRITIPSYLKEYAGIKNSVVVAGLFNRLEVWSVEKWNQYKKEKEKESSNIVEQLGDLGV